MGLDSEVAAVRQRVSPSVQRRLDEAARRRRRVVRDLANEGRWVDEEEIRERLARRRLIPSAQEYAPSELPAVGPGLDQLPIFFDGRPGPVGLAEAGEAWEGVEIAPEGGSRTVGVVIPPDAPPPLDPDAEKLLAGYLRYVLARDSFLAAVHGDTLGGSGGTVEEVALYEVRTIGSDVLARGAVRARFRGESGGRLTSTDVELGIRATDQDWLDRPTWGSRL